MTPRRALLVWAALLALLALTAASARLQLGAWNSVVNLVIAVAKAALVGWFYMELHAPRPALRIAAATGLAGLALLLALSAADYATRAHWPAPWQAPAAPPPGG